MGQFAPSGFGLLKSIREKKRPNQCNYLALGGVILLPTKKHVGFSSALPFGTLSPKTHNFLPNAFKPENITLVFSI